MNSYPKEKIVYYEKYNKKNVSVDMDLLRNLIKPENNTFGFLIEKSELSNWMERITVEIFIPN